MPIAKARLPRTFRLFLALWPDDEIRHAIGEHASGWSLPSGSVRYGPADWHVTLHFLGSVASDRVPDIAVGMDVPLEPFELTLDRPLLWPRGLAVVAASQVPTALKDLHDRLGQALQILQQPVEPRAYRPHLTLARRADGAIRPTAPVAVVWPVRSFALVVSTGRTDHRYEVLRTYG